ncbi:hypothetical protein ACQCSX_21975 (plasmid) [Pseudarthrobacter sp. P1]|uniref:hypothetical protein n=1 Tax=Pseudarthrobacter sp. P1 TaxID=3418418 RepID=UPI003CFAA187
MVATPAARRSAMVIRPSGREPAEGAWLLEGDALTVVPQVLHDVALRSLGVW